MVYSSLSEERPFGNSGKIGRSFLFIGFFQAVYQMKCGRIALSLKKPACPAYPAYGIGQIAEAQRQEHEVSGPRRKPLTSCAALWIKKKGRNLVRGSCPLV
jgi:hypothetical protein